MAKCLECGNEFEATSPKKKFCTIPCKSSFHRKATVSRIVSESVTVSGPIVSESYRTVSEMPLIVSPERIVSEESDDDVGIPAKVLDLVKDLHLNIEKDLGIYGWTADGIFIRPDIRIGQVQNIARLVHAKNGRVCPEFRQCGL
jgi:hypothetical protein